MPCLIVLWERFCTLIFPSLALMFISLTFLSLTFTLSSFAFSSLFSRFYYFELYFLKPHFVDSLHFFDPNPTIPNLCLRNICLVTSIVRRISKQTSWRTYKDNISREKLRLQGLQEKDNQGQITRTKHLELEGWKDFNKIFLYGLELKRLID